MGVVGAVTRRSLADFTTRTKLFSFVLLSADNLRMSWLARSPKKQERRGNLRAMPRHVSIVALAVVLSLFGGMAAGAETELQKAEREAAQAEAARLAAEQGYIGFRDVAADLNLQLILTLEEYTRVNADLQQLGLFVAGVRAEMDDTRAEIRGLDSMAQERAVSAYIRGMSTTSNLFISETFDDMAVATEAIKRASDEDELLFQTLDDRRTDLSRQTTELTAALDELAITNDALDVKRQELEGLFALADQRVVAAFQNLNNADAEYQAALATLEEEKAKRRWLGGVAQWRPLVEQYFPAEYVEEAMIIMACESGGNPDAKNPNSTATGLFQFLDGTWAWMTVLSGWEGHSRLDPEANVAVAAYLFEYSIRTNHPLGRWGHWECQP